MTKVLNQFSPAEIKALEVKFLKLAEDGEVKSNIELKRKLAVEEDVFYAILNNLYEQGKITKVNKIAGGAVKIVT